MAPQLKSNKKYIHHNNATQKDLCHFGCKNTLSSLNGNKLLPQKKTPLDNTIFVITNTTIVYFFLMKIHPIYLKISMTLFTLNG